MSNYATIESHSSREAPVLDLAGYTTVEDFMQKVFRKDVAKAVLAPVAEADDGAEGETRLAGELIEKASQTIDHLVDRCGHLEIQLQQAYERSSEQAAFIESLKHALTELKTRSDSLEVNLTSSLTRCETAEARVVSLEEYQRAVTLRVKRAEGISSKLQQQVEAAFGAGSPIQSVMNAISLQKAAE